jgi:opacity protein-like surface antigen
MDFVDSSLFQREAEISVAGVNALPDTTHRDIYLSVETKKLPRRIEASENPFVGAKPGRFGRIDTAIGTHRPLSHDRSGQNFSYNSEEPFAYLNGKYPSYLVRAYRDTGKSKIIKGKTLKILEPQSSYGYYVRHDGKLFGWKHKLEGSSVEQIEPNIYRVSVPNNSVTVATTTIESIESAWAVNARIGITRPSNPFSNLVDSGYSGRIGLEYFTTPALSIEGILGLQQFDDNSLGEALKIDQLAINARYYFKPNKVRAFINAGVGIYDMKPGDSQMGRNAGAGFQFDIAADVSIEAAYNLHRINGLTTTTEYSTLEVGVHYLF